MVKLGMQSLTMPTLLIVQKSQLFQMLYFSNASSNFMVFWVLCPNFRNTYFEIWIRRLILLSKKYFNYMFCIWILKGVNANITANFTEATNLNYSLTQCMLHFEYYQVYWFTLTLLRPTRYWSKWSQYNAYAYHNSGQMYQPRLELVSNR